MRESATIGAGSYTGDWYLPSAGASALMVLENGFSRTCANVRGTSKAVAEAGVMVLCVNADMTAGNPALAADLADTLTERTLTPPGGAILPAPLRAPGRDADPRILTTLSPVAPGFRGDRRRQLVLQ